MPPKLRVMVLFGGRSAEHEISVLSARFIASSLDPERFVPILVGIDKQGRWQLQSQDVLLATSSDPRLSMVSSGKTEINLEPRPDASNQHRLTAEGQPSIDVDVVFPVLHGPLGEDGTVQGLLELAGLPYVGAGVLGSAVGMDKDVMKRLLLQAGLRVLPYTAVRKAAFHAAPVQMLKQLAEFALPVFVKPANLGSSVGISRVTQPNQLREAVELAFEFDDKIVVEQGLNRPREIECAVLEGEPLLVSVPGEIEVRHADGFYSYAAKYLDEGSATLRIPADLSEQQTAQAQQLAQRTFEALECRGMARVDLFLDDKGNLFVNEINTIPGFTAISMYPKLMEASGVSARQLVSRLIDSALDRAREKKARRSSV